MAGERRGSVSSAASHVCAHSPRVNASIWTRTASACRSARRSAGGTKVARATSALAMCRAALASVMVWKTPSDWVVPW